MSGFKISDIAKKLDKTVEEVRTLILEQGLKMSDDGETVTDEAAAKLGVDPKHMKLDRRQEMLKKAMERHKRHPRAKEVKVKNGQTEATVRKKVSKEELMERKRELEKSLKKVDEQRESEAEAPKAQEQKPAQTRQAAPAETKDKTPETQADAKPAEKQAEQTVKKEEKPEAKEASKPEEKKPEVKKPEVRKTEERKPPRKPVREGTMAKPSDKPREERPKPQRERTDNRQQNRPERQSRPEGRTQAPRPQRPAGQRPSEDASLADEIKKRKLREKEKEKEKEAKRLKNAKGGKKEKSFHKVINEGFDELLLEEEVEKLPTDQSTEDVVEVDVEEVVKAKEKEEKEKAAKEAKEKEKAKDINRQQPSRHENRRFTGGFQPGRQKKRGGRNKKQDKVERPVVRPSSVQIGENILVSDLARLMGVKAAELIKHLMGLGIMANMNQAIDAETAELLGQEYGIEIQVKTVTEEDILPSIEDKDEDMKPRPPIVTVMGHVDHGKTSLLDAIRKTSVAEKEAGGITQHIGAYEVDMDTGKIVFLDTPGHEAFTTLRARGAHVTDIVILMVAADDGVMPQTKEAIEHVKAAGVRMIVAINKVDKENANVDMVRNQLSELNVISEDWGGDYQFQEISAKNELGIEDLLERVLLEAELLELKGNADRLAEGIVIESKLDKQKGPVATVLITKGTLKKGDNFVVGSEYGKVRAMFNYKGQSIKEAGLSIPVELMGFSGVPQSGDKLHATEDERTAKQVAMLRSDSQREEQSLEKAKVSLADLFDRIKEGELKDLNIVLKADVQGSLEALRTSLEKLSNPEVKINIISSSVGGISENDIILADASNALVIGFSVRPDAKAKQKAEKEGIEINLYSVIYQIIDDVKSAMEGMLDPERREEIIGRAEIRQVFSVPKKGKIGGCYVLDGKITRNSKVRVVRDSIVVFDGNIDSLKRFQDDAKEVQAGYECGIGVEKYNDIKEGDILEAYLIVEEKRTLDDVAKE